MAVFVISFRVGDEGNRQSRWASIVKAIEAESRGSFTWEETTSFYLIESDRTSGDIAQSIYLESEMHSEWDKLLVINLSKKGHTAKGKIDYPTMLESIMNSR